MSVSARVHYAAQALTELSIRCQDVNPVTIREITDRHGVPGPFLTQILRTLRTAGWVQSIRGAQGGYRLNVDADSITLLDVAKLMDGGDGSVAGGGDASTSGARLHHCWSEADAAYERVLASTTIADVDERVRSGDEAMYFI